MSGLREQENSGAGKMGPKPEREQENGRTTNEGPPRWKCSLTSQLLGSEERSRPHVDTRPCIRQMTNLLYSTGNATQRSAAAAAKSLQSCPTLCDPIDGGPPGSPSPWDSPGNNTGVGCHFLLQRMKGKSESEVTQSCPTLRDPMVCSLPRSSVHGIFQARVLEWGAIAFSSIHTYTPTIFENITTSNKAPVLRSFLNIVQSSTMLITLLGADNTTQRMLITVGSLFNWSKTIYKVKFSSSLSLSSSSFPVFLPPFPLSFLPLFHY